MGKTAKSSSADRQFGRLRLIQTTDLHMNLLPYDYVTDKLGGDFSLARIAPEIERLRSEGIPTVLFDTGDFLQGNQLADFVAAHCDNIAVHPMIDAMNGLAYDAVTLGNHEFDYGLPVLIRALADLRCPVVAANVACADGTQIAPRYAVLTREITCKDGAVRTCRIGVFGIVTPQLGADVTDPSGAALVTCDIVEAAKSVLPHLKAADADIIVALCHCGIGDSIHSHMMEDAAIPLARLEEIDVLLTGHLHGIFPDPRQPQKPGVDQLRGTILGKPAVMSGAFGNHLGVIDLVLTWEAGKWTVDGHTTRVIPTRDIPDRPTAQTAVIASSIMDLHQRTLEHMRTPIAVTRTHLHSYLSMVGLDKTLALLANAQIDFVARALEGGPYDHLPVLGAVAPYRAGGRAGPSHYNSVQPGPITLRDATAIYPFTNHLMAVRRSGADLRRLLTRASGLFAQMLPGQRNQPLLSPDFAPYAHDTLYGLTYRFDLSQPIATRVTDLRHNGCEVHDDDQFIVAATTFRVNGGGGYDVVPQKDRLLTTKPTAAEILVEYLKDQVEITISSDPVWDFAPMPGTSCTFQSAPVTAGYLDDLPDREIRYIGLRSDGFADFVLEL